MTAVWALRLEDLVSDGVVSPRGCDPMVVPERGVGLRSVHPTGGSRGCRPGRCRTRATGCACG